MKNFYFLLLLLFSFSSSICAQIQNYSKDQNKIYLDSKEVHDGHFKWEMQKAADVKDIAEKISNPDYATSGWKSAVVPGTVLTSLVYNKVLPDPYFGINNKIEKNIIPDIAKVGRDFYTYWFRTEFKIPDSYKNKIIWLQVDGINYRAEVWVNGHLLGNMAGMFRAGYINITDFAKVGQNNALAIKVLPVDVPGTTMSKKWGAPGEYQNGGDGYIGLNTTMLMSAGWDFTFYDGIRDRNTGIWKNIMLYATDRAVLRHPFIKSDLSKPLYNESRETVSVEVTNPMVADTVNCTIKGEIVGENISFSKDISLFSGETREVKFTPEEFKQLIIKNPRLWWPHFKGNPEMYELKLTAYINNKVSDQVKTRFGIREIITNQDTPDHSRQFIVNGKKVFVRGANWIPEAMLRSTDAQTYAELRYSQQSGINFIRLWGGGIAESDYFYQMCDELGLMVWQEFWLSGNTYFPSDVSLYLSNVESTVKRLRNHPSLSYYVSSNESTEMPGTEDLIMKIDGTRSYQMESECCGVHDGSPYKQVNPMRYFEDTASDRGSRINGFNPEYGTPNIPIYESFSSFMDKKDQWPINYEVWDYHDGGNFNLMTTLYKDLADKYGKCTSLKDFTVKGQFVGAMSNRSLWEAWNYNKLNYGDRYTSGLLYWYYNSPVPQSSAHMWDYNLEPTSGLYYTQNALEPLHAQFDYLKNTVSVYNDFYRAFKNYKISADVYNLNAKKVWSKVAIINIPEDGVVNDVFKITFPSNITNVHFIKLRLYDEKGKEVANSFYWRSNDKYLGPHTETGPATAGFEDINKLLPAKVKTSIISYNREDRHYIKATIKNTSSSIAFFVQLQLLNDKQTPVCPTFMTDNFFSLLPGENKTITIETAKTDMPQKPVFVVKGWNLEPLSFKIQDTKTIHDKN